MSHPSNLVRGITFDAGGTLIDPYPSVGDVYASYLRKVGVCVEPAALETRFASAFRSVRALRREKINDDTEKAFWKTVCRSTFGDYCSHAQFQTVFAELYAAFASVRHWKLKQGAAKTLRELSRRGYRLGVISNADSRFHTVLNQLNLRDHFEFVLLSTDCGYEKPDCRIFLSAERRFDLPAEQLLHLGDSIGPDFNGAREAGWQAILLASPKTKTVGPSKQVQHLPDLLDLLPLL